MWYKLFRLYVKIGLFFTHKSIKVYGKENIPKNGPTIFIGNHQNALIDAILIPTTNSRDIHFLTRASSFVNNTVSNFLRSLNMIAVYRIRDGRNSMQKNIDVFKQCFEILKDEKSVQIFAEGEHHLKRSIIPLKKGFARIILGSLQKYPHLNIKIVPVGLNYDTRLGFPASATVYYGKPIDANEYFDLDQPDLTYKSILKKVSSELKKLTTHIDTNENYDQTLTTLKSFGIDFLNPIEANAKIKEIEELNLKPLISKPVKHINWFTPIHLITKLNSLFPLLIWQFLKTKINDIIFTNTYRFALIATVFPLFYLIQTLVVSYLFNSKIALVYLVTSILLGIITKNTLKINR